MSDCLRNGPSSSHVISEQSRPGIRPGGTYVSVFMMKARSFIYWHRTVERGASHLGLMERAHVVAILRSKRRIT